METIWHMRKVLEELLSYDGLQGEGTQVYKVGGSYRNSTWRTKPGREGPPDPETELMPYLQAPAGLKEGGR